jgi:hypothetical protein
MLGYLRERDYPAAGIYARDGYWMLGIYTRSCCMLGYLRERDYPAAGIYARDGYWMLGHLHKRLLYARVFTGAELFPDGGSLLCAVTFTRVRVAGSNALH